MPETVSTAPETALQSISAQELAPKHRRRKITNYDIEQMAKLYRDGCSDVEACQTYGIKEDTWFHWKSRKKNEASFIQVLSRLRGNRKVGAFKRIEMCADGIGMKQPDWRAAEALLKLTDPERFGDKQAPAQVNVSLYAQFGHTDIGAKVYARRRAQDQAKAITVQEVKQLPSYCGQDTPTGSGASV